MAGGNNRFLSPSRPRALLPPLRLLVLVLTTAATGVGAVPISAMPLDASHQACRERLLHQPAANAELVAMICDAQTYPDPAASAAEQRRRQLLEETQQAFERQQDDLYRAWLVRHPNGNRRQWQESHQAALDQRRAAFAEQQEHHRQQEERLEQARRRIDQKRRQDEARLDWQCWLERARRSGLITSDMERIINGTHREPFRDPPPLQLLSSACLHRPTQSIHQLLRSQPLLTPDL